MAAKGPLSFNLDSTSLVSLPSELHPLIYSYWLTHKHIQGKNFVTRLTLDQIEELSNQATSSRKILVLTLLFMVEMESSELALLVAKMKLGIFIFLTPVPSMSKFLIVKALIFVLLVHGTRAINVELSVLL